MNEIDKIIYDLFTSIGEWRITTVEDMRKELRRNLENQVDGCWSGKSAYSIMVYGGFLIDGKSCEPKKLTKLGEVFMNSFSVNED